MKALFLSIGVVFSLISIGALADNESKGMGVFFLVVAIVFIAVGLKKQKKPAAPAQAPSLPLNGTIIPRINNPLPPSTTPAMPESAPEAVKYAPTYPKKSGKKFLYRHYKNVSIYTPEDYNLDLKLIDCFDKIRFELEPDNEYDPGAVKVFCGNTDIGYLYKNGFQKMVRDFIEKDDRFVLGHISNINENGKIFIDEIFYRESDPLFECALTSNSSNASQEAIDLCEVNDVLQIEYDYEKDAFCAEDCGKIPKKFAEELDDDGVYIGIVLDKYFSGEGITDTKQNLKIAVYETAD